MQRSSPFMSLLKVRSSHLNLLTFSQSFKGSNELRLTSELPGECCNHILLILGRYTESFRTPVLIGHDFVMYARRDLTVAV